MKYVVINVERGGDDDGNDCDKVVKCDVINYGNDEQTTTLMN